MVRRRGFLRLFGASAASASVPAAGQTARPAAATDEHDTDDWLVHYTLDVGIDGRARITLAVEGSEIPTRVTLMKGKTEGLEVRSGQSALTVRSHTINWDTTVTDSIAYSVRLGHLQLGVSEMAVLEDSVIFRDYELAPVGAWKGGLQSLPRGHRLTIEPPDGWSVIAPGRKVAPDTYEVVPSIAPHSPLRDLFAVGEFDVHTTTVDDTELRVAELPSADGPPVEEALALLADTQPVVEDFFGEAATYPRAAVVVPTDVHPGGGFARDNSFLVSENKPLYDTGTGESHYVHEFAHTWQRFRAPPWHVEGPVSWLGFLALYEAGEISEADAIHMLRVWASESHDEVGDPITVPANDARHGKGAAVAAALDVDVRARTGGEADLGAVLSRVNDQRFDPEYTIDREEEIDALLAVTGVDYAEFFERFVDGPDYPAAILAEDFSIDAPSTVWGPAFEVSGVEVSSREVPPGESVTVSAEVTNAGGDPGRTEIRLYVDGEAVASRPVALEPDETATVTFERTFEEPGERTLRIDDRSIGTVAVTDSSPEFEVVDAEVSEATVTPGEPVVVTAELANDGEVDGHVDVEVTVDGEPVATTSVWIAAGDRETVSFRHRFETEGSFDVAVDGVDAGTVAVRPAETPTGTPSTGDATSVWSPGFGVLGTLASLGVGYLLARRSGDDR